MLEILSILPSDKSINIPIDQKIQIVFSEEIDTFSVINGISIYTSSDGVWTGSELSQLDTKYSDVTDVNNDYNIVGYTYIINGNTITLTPSSKLLEDKTYNISLFPGDDVTKFISTKTFATPILSQACSGITEVTSSYIGTENGTYTLYFNSNNSFDLDFNLVYSDSYTFTDGQELNIGNISIKLSGVFQSGDTVEIPVFKATSLDALYKTSFTTNKYTTSAPTSQRVNDYTYTEQNLFNIVNSIPENNSVNNIPSNPITIKFNSNIKLDQDISNKINIKRISLEDGKVKQLNYKYKIIGNILKLYLTS